MEGKIRFVLESGELDDLEPGVCSRGRAATAIQRPEQPPETRKANCDNVHSDVFSVRGFLYLFRHQHY